MQSLAGLKCGGFSNYFFTVISPTSLTVFAVETYFLYSCKESRQRNTPPRKNLIQPFTKNDRIILELATLKQPKLFYRSKLRLGFFKGVKERYYFFGNLLIIKILF
ncbi:hypothetical protein A6A20_07760 [Volucribacter amazonae]|uniref:Uncharacterized protein n=1 Tax=Volucribacter amazonae TaxID=256731 RepID=A0A9X4PC98_9PAST|nr:hypothetical protein [Volucribacter amazonae]